MNKVFLDDLPKRGSQIDWKNSMGCKVKFLYENIQDEIEIVSYESKRQKLYIKYLDKEPFKIKTCHFVNCHFGKLLSKITNEFKVEIGGIFKDNKRDLIIIDKEYRKDKNNINRKWYKYHCNRCGYNEGWIVESHLFGGKGCQCCCLSPRIAIEGINDIPITVSWMVKYFQGGYDEAKLYTKSSNKKIYPICPDCGRIKSKAIKIQDIYKKHSISCICGDGFSYPEKIMFDILKQLKIEFINEYSPDWIKPRRYDFYFELNNKEYIIEMDGALGHGNRVHSKSKLTKEESEEIDYCKDKLADKHGIEVIRIDCYESDLEYIKKNILKSKLSELFNLSNIDWKLVEEFALSNLVKVICDFKKENPDMSVNKISNILGLNKNTITNYLKKSSKLGWCNYNPKEEMRKSNGKNGKNNGKPVEMFKNGKSLGIFESCSELERQSEESFGVKLLFSGISAVCRNAQKTHRGYTFKYII